jgi:hypothetical protein
VPAMPYFRQSTVCSIMPGSIVIPAFAMPAA